MLHKICNSHTSCLGVGWCGWPDGIDFSRRLGVQLNRFLQLFALYPILTGYLVTLFIATSLVDMIASYLFLFVLQYEALISIVNEMRVESSTL